MHSSIYPRSHRGDAGAQYYDSSWIKPPPDAPGAKFLVARKPLPMETVATFQVPRRLTQLYSDTKVSCDAVIEQEKNSPEVDALQRKFRIQTSRLRAWGLQWSDNSQGKQDADIDESLEAAGLTDTVRDVLRTIQDILNEAGRMQHTVPHGAAKSGTGEKGGLPRDSRTWAASEWRSRYESLAAELTTSIDTLYDISRSRQFIRERSRGTSPDVKTVPPYQRSAKSAPVFTSTDYNASDLTLINPSTIHDFGPLDTRPVGHLPPKLSPHLLRLPQEHRPPYESQEDPTALQNLAGPSSYRAIGRFLGSVSVPGSEKFEAAGTPVLVEYADFDPTYRLTQVAPPLDRFESLLTILSRVRDEHARSAHGILSCLGYFEDPERPRFGLVYELPSFVYSGPADVYKRMEELQPATLLKVLQTGSKSQHNTSSASPSLENRFRLALTLATTFSKLHEEGFVHKNVSSSNILIFRNRRAGSENTRALQFALRSPVVCSFDLFSHTAIPNPGRSEPLNIYKHPEDPKVTGQKQIEYGPHFDMYSLGLVLLEIGHWMPLSDCWKKKYTLADFKLRIEENYVRRLASKCGTAYMKAVRDCLSAASMTGTSPEHAERTRRLYARICKRLQRCCLIDESDGEMDPLEINLDFKMAGTSQLKRKNFPSGTESESLSTSHRSAKRWAVEKSTEILERTRSLSKSSPSASPKLSSASPRQEFSPKSFHKTISHLMSPRERVGESFEWQNPRSRSIPAESASLLSLTTTPVPTANATGTDDTLSTQMKGTVLGDVERTGRSDSLETPGGSMSWKDYRERIMIIQKAWRKRKAARSNSIQTLLTVATPPASLGYTPQHDPVSGQPAYRNPPYPTPEPEIQEVPCVRMSNADDIVTSTIEIQRVEPAPRRTLKVHPVTFPSGVLEEWHNKLLPRAERIIQRVLKGSDETVSIDLLAIGETIEVARSKPTIVVTCSSVGKVKSALKRKLHHNEESYALLVRSGRIRRSKVSQSRTSRRKPPHRSMKNTDNHDGDMAVMNPFHQQRPVCGASIGAFRGEHLPPVSFGGVVMVDNEPMGMTVHHLLDAPSDDEGGSDDEDEGGLSDFGAGPNDAVLSSARSGELNPWLMGMGSQPGVQYESNSPAPMWELEISDDDLKSDDEEEDFYYSDFDSDAESDNGELADSVYSTVTEGDIDGIPVGDGDEIRITQPALDDVQEDFFPEPEDRDDDHLASHELGYVHASSGIRRWNRNGVLHEIDWALLTINENRLQPYNLVQGGRQFCSTSRGMEVEQDQWEISSKLTQPVARHHYRAEEDEYPNSVAAADSLGGMMVHCFGRTTGLQGGMIGSAMSSVRIYRRKSFSRSWNVIGGFGRKSSLFPTRTILT